MPIRAIALGLMLCYGTAAAAATTASAGAGSNRPADKPIKHPAVYYLAEPAPPNDCGPHSFEILNADPGEPRCVGLPWVPQRLDWGF